MSASRWVVIGAVGLLTACNTGAFVRDPIVMDGGFPEAGDGGMDSMDVGPMDIQAIEVVNRDVPRPDPDAFFAMDPPPMFCGPRAADGGGLPDVMMPPTPGGTPECPDDKNRQGCPCPLELIGQERPCWPGLRVNRSRGQCRDGVTRCEPFSEIAGRWGECRGAVLRDPMVSRGPGACQCFSRGSWRINNATICALTYPSGPYAVSTFVNAMGQPSCPTNPGMTPPPQPQPGSVWSQNSLTVDCEGEFELCITIKAGDIRNPQPTDCVLARRCTNGWYGARGMPQEFPPLDNWGSPDTACAQRFLDGNGYGELSVRGRSAECQNIDDGAGQPYVFTRMGFCAPRCAADMTQPGCQNCNANPIGMF